MEEGEPGFDSFVLHAHGRHDRAEMAVGARVLLYPSENRHSALTRWLEAIAEKFERETADWD